MFPSPVLRAQYLITYTVQKLEAQNTYFAFCCANGEGGYGCGSGASKLSEVLLGIRTKPVALNLPDGIVSS